MFLKTELTLGAFKDAYLKKGKTIPKTNLHGIINLIEQNKKTNPKKIKTRYPVMYVYSGKKGTLSYERDHEGNLTDRVSTGSNVFFIDIDTKHGVDFVIEHAEEMFGDGLQNVVFLQKSPSGKLHIVGMFNETIYDEDEFTFQYHLHTAVILRTIDRWHMELKGEPLNYYTYKIENDKTAFDDHNSKFTQMLYLSHNPLIINKHLLPVTLSKELKKQIIEYVGDELGLDYFKPKVKHERRATPTVKYTLNEGGSKKVYNGSKPIINSSFPPLFSSAKFKLTGWELRWRICAVLHYMFGWDKAQEMIIEHYGNPEDFFSSYSPNYERILTYVGDPFWKMVEEYLRSDFGIDKEFDDIKAEGVKVVNYVCDDIDNIIEVITNEDRICIDAATGTGKTTLINTLVDRCKLKDGGQYDIMGVVNKGLNYKLLIATPYIALNELYIKVNVYTAEKGEAFDYKDSCVMVWDQAIKYINNLPKDYIIVVDESHVLFLSRRYRKSAVKFYNYLKTTPNKVVCLTATPEGEVDGLGLKVFKYQKDRPTNVFVEAIKIESKVDGRMYIDIMNEMRDKNYDNICVFDNKGLKRMYGTLFDDNYIDEVGYFRSNTRRNTDFVQLCDTEVLTKKINLCTCVAYNGFNFNNEGKILVLMRFEEGITPYSEIVQAVGRFRKAKSITVKLYIPKMVSRDADIELQRDNALRCHKRGIEPYIIKYNEMDTDDEFFEGKKDAADYIKKYSTWEYVKDRLERTGYIHIEEIDGDVEDVLTSIGVETTEDVSGLVDVAERVVGKAWKQDKIDGVTYNELVGNNEYYLKFEEKLNRIKNLYPFIDDEIVRVVIQSLHPNCMPKKILRRLYDLGMVTTMDDYKLNELLSNLMDLKLGWSVHRLGATVYDKKTKTYKRPYYNSVEHNITMCERLLEDIFSREEECTLDEVERYIDELNPKIYTIDEVMDNLESILSQQTPQIEYLEVIQVLVKRFYAKKQGKTIEGDVKEDLVKLLGLLEGLKRYVERNVIDVKKEHLMSVYNDKYNECKDRIADINTCIGLYQKCKKDLDTYKNCVIKELNFKWEELVDETTERCSKGGSTSRRNKQIVYDKTLTFDSVTEFERYFKDQGYTNYQIQKLKLNKKKYVVVENKQK